MTALIITIVGMVVAVGGVLLMWHHGWRLHQQATELIDDLVELQGAVLRSENEELKVIVDKQIDRRLASYGVSPRKEPPS